MTLKRIRRCSIVVLAVAATMVAAGRAWGIGFILSETKEELKLEYDVAVTDHGTGRVTVVFTLADEGRLRPLDEVELAIPAEQANPDGGRWMDLVLSIDMEAADGGRSVGRVHLLKSLAERAEIRLNTHTMDGRLDPRTRLHHVIRVADHMKEPQAAAPAGRQVEEPRADGATAREVDK